MRVWKLVSVIKHWQTREVLRRNSLFQEMFPVEYAQDVQAFPKIPGSFLYAFRTLEAAQRYMRTCSFTTGTMELWECEAGISRKYPLTAVKAYDVERFWAEREHTWYTEAPAGTVWCKSITLKKLIQTEERKP